LSRDRSCTSEQTSFDAGEDAGGADPVLDAGIPEELTLQVSSNPNSVLSAIATMTWTGSFDTVSIAWEGGQTPTFELTKARSSATYPILGLAAGTTYTFQATGQDAEGRTLVSNQVVWTSGDLPPDLPVVTTQGTATGSGLTLISASVPTTGVDTYYVMVVNSAGTPVWYYGLPNDLPLWCDFQQQPDGTFTVAVADWARTIPGLSAPIVTQNQIDVLGNPIHTWEALGPDNAGGVVIDMKGNQVQVAATDGHDIRLLSDGSALLLGLVVEPMDLSAVGGSPDSLVVGDILENVTADGRVLFAWNSLEYFTPFDVDPAASDFSTPTIDMTHGNSIDVTRDGNYLVSFRNLSKIVKINAASGEIIWQLGGAGISSPWSGGPAGDFTFVNDPLGGFSCQHGARELPNGDILLFDDGNGHPTQESRAVEYALDTNAMTATMVWESTPSVSLYTTILGYGQRLSSGGTLVTYGSTNTVEEWDPTGTNVVWTLTDPANPLGFYRSFRIGSLYSYVPQ
jgi:hypothetical protein